MSNRWMIETIAAMVPQGSRVLDLGCGDGALLSHLQQHRGCTGYGVEIDDTNVAACVERSVNVIQLNLDQGLLERVVGSHANHTKTALPVV